MKRFLLVFVLAASAIFPAMAEDFASDVKAGPWITQMTENGMTVEWTSNTPGQAWVELDNGTVVWETFAGRRVFGIFHRVDIEGLTPGTEVNYRVGGRLVVDDRNARDPKMGDTYCDEWRTVKTFDTKAKTCRFTMFNDIHLDVEKYAAMAAEIDKDNTDFIFLDGDIVSAGNYTLDSYLDYTIAPLGDLPTSLPLYFARGNHEGRGNAVQLVSEVFPNKVGKGFFYTFRQGPVAFIVFDAGETSETRSMAYSGSEVFEDYLAEQLEWAKKAMKEPAFRKAPVKVCLVHVPMIDHPNKDDYTIQRWMNHHFIDLLNKNHINLMLGADLHEYRYDAAGKMNNSFPIITNSEVERLVFDCEGKKIAVRIYDSNGALLHSHDF